MKLKEILKPNRGNSMSKKTSLKEILKEGVGNRWHWVEDDKEVVLFVGTEAQARSYYKKNGGSKSGLHLMSMGKAQGGSGPVVGKVVE